MKILKLESTKNEMVRKIRNGRFLLGVVVILLTGFEPCFSQTQKIPVLKTMNDSGFSPGDEIKMPIIVFPCCDGHDPFADPIFKDSVDIIGDFLKKYSNLVVEMGCCTSYRSDAKYNQVLSFNRAKTLIDYLMTERGVDPNRITPMGYGESNPRYIKVPLVLPSGKIIPVGTFLTQLWIDKNYPMSKDEVDYEFVMKQNRRALLTVIRTDFAK